MSTLSDEVRVSSKEEVTMQRILVPLDGSELSEAILPVIADGFDPADTEVVFLRVGDPVDAIMGAGSHDMHPLGVVGSTAPATVAALAGRDWGEAKGQGFDRARQQLESYLDHRSKLLALQGFHVETVVGFSVDPAVVIADCAKQQRVDVIAMSTHGRTGLAGALLGSVASAVLKSSRLPVLLTRPVPVA
jgi:nucleotide-binding universal stress UspA family protein